MGALSNTAFLKNIFSKPGKYAPPTVPLLFFEKLPGIGYGLL
jgi:hypothetical protein